MDENGPDYGDPAVEEAWCDAQRRDVIDYLKRQELVHGRVGEWPAWHVAPVVSFWAIESGTHPGSMGWWVICGDLPTDYISALDARDPREAFRVFAERWSMAAAAMRAGRAASDISIGSTPDERRLLAPMLESRASLLTEWADRDDVWEDLFNE